MLRWSYISYSRELPQPIVTAHGAYCRRDGFIVCVDSEHGCAGLGDVAPLPGFSRESLPEALAQWEALVPQLVELSLPMSVSDLRATMRKLDADRTTYPSLRFGIESALADAAACLAQQPLRQWLNPGAVASIEINALLKSQDVDDLIAEFDQRAGEGYTCFKVKVGVADVSDDVRRLRALRNHSQAARLRPDVNAGWSSEQLQTFCRACRDLHLEFIEQPLAVGHARQARQICRDAGIRLALDEEVVNTADAEQLLCDDLCDVLVLKPVTVGGMTPCLELAHVARRRGKQIVLTSAWESDVGLAATAHLAAACGDVAAVSGLSTAGTIADGLVSPALVIERGRIDLGAASGLGLSLVR
ncbi:MAG: o-succinylbenzoate synthase [Candidatus Zixiibacteriota bacterium]